MSKLIKDTLYGDYDCVLDWSIPELISKAGVLILRGKLAAYKLIDGANVSVEGTKHLPNNINRRIVPVFTIGWTSTAAVGTLCYWLLYYQCVKAGDSVNVWDTATPCLAPTNGTALLLTYSDITLDINFFATNKRRFRFELFRLGALAADTLGQDVFVHSLELSFKYLEPDTEDYYLIARDWSNKTNIGKVNMDRPDVFKKGLLDNDKT